MSKRSKSAGGAAVVVAGADGAALGGGPGAGFAADVEEFGDALDDHAVDVGHRHDSERIEKLLQRAVRRLAQRPVAAGPGRAGAGRAVRWLATPP